MNEIASFSLWKKFAEISYAMYLLDTPTRILYLGIRYQDFTNAVSGAPILENSHNWELPAFFILELLISWIVTESFNQLMHLLQYNQHSGEELDVQNKTVSKSNDVED